jgi:hypothetical protein
MGITVKKSMSGNTDILDIPLLERARLLRNGDMKTRIEQEVERHLDAWLEGPGYYVITGNV